MSANYKLVRNPDPKKTGKKQALHARLVPNGTIRTPELLNRAQDLSSLSSADLKAALQIFQDMLANYLIYGYNVELEGIGTFSVSLQCPPVTDKRQIRAESVHFRDVNFRPSLQLKKQLKAMPVFRANVPEASYMPKEECEQKVFRYLETQPYITSQIYRQLCGCGHTKASAHLKQMATEGKLERKFIGRSRLYIKPKISNFASINVD